MRCINFRRYYQMSGNYNHIEEMLKAAEAKGGSFGGKEANSVRRIANEMMSQLGFHNKVEDVRQDNIFWQIDFGGTMDGEQRKILQARIAEALDIMPKRIKLVGLYPPQK